MTIKEVFDEILDVVDNNNIVIAQDYKKNIHQNNLLHRSSHIIISYKNYIFLQLRSKHKQQFPNKWDISAAGHVITQESYLGCAIRELQEELGLRALEKDLIEITTLPASEETGFEFIRVFYLQLNSLPEITLDPDEVTSGGWFKNEDITTWLSGCPEDFAGCFELIWTAYLNFITSANKS